MRVLFRVLTCGALLVPSLPMAQGLLPGGLLPDAEALRLAIESGVCGPAGVAEAGFQPDGVIAAICADDATGFVPVVGLAGLGGAGPFAAAVAAGLIGVVASGDENVGAPPDTQ